MTEMVVLHELVLDADGKPADYRILDCNRAFTQVTGIERRDAVGHLASVVYGQEKAPYLDIYARVAFSGEPLSYSTYYAPMRKHFSISVVSPGAKRFATITTDITELKEIEAALHMKVEELEIQKELFTLFMDYLPAIVFMKDDEGRTLYTNREMNRVLGAEGWIGKKAAEIFDRDVAARVEEDDALTMREGYRRIKESFPSSNGEIRDYETQKFVIPRSGRRPLLGGIAIDVTAERRAEATLRDKIEELDIYFASSLDLLCIADTGGHFLRLNPEWEAILGYAVGELEGKAFLDYVHPDDKEATLAAIAALGNAEDVLNFENRYRHKDGSYRWIEWRSRPRGGLIYAAARDVTERKDIEGELRKQVAEKETLLSEVHHRIKNNLASIKGLLVLQLAETESEAARVALQDAAGRIESMRALYERLLLGDEFAQTSAREYVGSIAESVREIFPRDPPVALELRVADLSLTPKQLFPLGIIVNELLTNALKYAFEGRIGGLVSVELEKTGEEVVLTVEDDGRGLPPHFDPEKSGGFGLMLVGMLSEQLRGTFSMGSAKGVRSVVRFPA